MEQVPEEIPMKMESILSRNSQTSEYEVKKLRLDEQKSRKSEIEQQRFSIIYVFSIPLEYK